MNGRRSATSLRKAKRSTIARTPLYGRGWLSCYLGIESTNPFISLSGQISRTGLYCNVLTSLCAVERHQCYQWVCKGAIDRMSISLIFPSFRQVIVRSKFCRLLGISGLPIKLFRRCTSGFRGGRMDWSRCNPDDWNQCDRVCVLLRSRCTICEVLLKSARRYFRYPFNNTDVVPGRQGRAKSHSSLRCHARQSWNVLDTRLYLADESLNPRWRLPSCCLAISCFLTNLSLRMPSSRASSSTMPHLDFLGGQSPGCSLVCIF